MWPTTMGSGFGRGQDEGVTSGEVLWTPPADVREHTRLGDFLRFVERTRGLSFDDYEAAWRWSVTDIADFWQAIWDYFEIDSETPPTQVVAEAALPGARWFLGSRVNYAEHVLRMPGLGDDEPAVLAWSQTRPAVTLTAAQLREEVRLVRSGLRRLGVGIGHRVAAYAPNIPETYVLMLAAASLGAVFSSCAPEFGTRSVVDRWQQIEPTVLFAVDGYQYGDKAVSRAGEVAEIRAALPSLTHVVSLSYLDSSTPSPAGALSWAELTTATDEPMEFDRVPFDHPLYVLYSSGTTGVP
jgi:acetoacetyl-CoA synthetase